jgi:hypothetical protein
VHDIVVVPPAMTPRLPDRDNGTATFPTCPVPAGPRAQVVAFLRERLS